MSNLNQFLNGVASRSPTSIIQRNATSGWLQTGYIYSVSGAGPNRVVGAKEILSGALTAATLATILSLTGGGVLSYLSVFQVDATARTLSLQLVIDGVTAFDSTSASSSDANSGSVIIGIGNNLSDYATAYIPFNTSLVVKVTSNLTETNKIGIGVKYYTV